jgi:hypothetical protein
MRSGNRYFVALTGSLLLIAAGVFAGWLMISSGVLASVSDASQGPSRPLVATADGLGQEAPPVNVVAGSFQLSQPRDPFRPLVGDGSRGGLPGVGGGDGGTFNPSNTITLQAITTVNGVLQATVVVNGTSYQVGVGDTFAGSYKVVSLTTDKGVFMFGDTAFELAVGQQILK